MSLQRIFITLLFSHQIIFLVNTSNVWVVYVLVHLLVSVVALFLVHAPPPTFSSLICSQEINLHVVISPMTTGGWVPIIFSSTVCLEFGLHLKLRLGFSFCFSWTSSCWWCYLHVFRCNNTKNDRNSCWSHRIHPAKMHIDCTYFKSIQGWIFKLK